MFMECKITCCSLKFFNKTTLFYCFFFFFFFFFSVCALFTTTLISNCTTPTCSDIKSPLTAFSDLHFPDFEKTTTTTTTSSKENSKDDDEEGGDMIVSIGNRRRSVILLSLARRYLSGPGSSPPRCTSKCGSCRPCKPVHVPVPPGTPVTAEYYPEAWRCKCGKRLYMP